MYFILNNNENLLNIVKPEELEHVFLKIITNMYKNSQKVSKCL